MFFEHKTINKICLHKSIYSLLFIIQFYIPSANVSPGSPVLQSHIQCHQTKAVIHSKSLIPAIITQDKDCQGQRAEQPRLHLRE